MLQKQNYIENNLTRVCPELILEWHPTKNGKLRPVDVTAGSKRKVWWLYSYDDLDTGKHFNFEWQATIYSRVAGCGCPYLSGQKVWPGFNDLATIRPDLTKQWHPTKNGKLKADSLTVLSHKKVWWLYPYDDLETGKHFDFEWEAVVSSREKNSGCPYLTSHGLWPGFNDLATKRPDLAKQWHPTKNGSLTPDRVMPCSATKVWWLYSYHDPKTGKHFDFEWEAKVSNRYNDRGCPYLSRPPKMIFPGFNDLETVRADLAKQWHPVKNGNLRPDMVTVSSNKRVWWLYPYDDSETGEHFDFEWEATVNTRTRESGCPYLSGQKVWPGFNDLATKRSDLAKQWHPTKNGNITSEMVGIHYSKKVWWLAPYDEPETGKHFDFEWDATVLNRVQSSGNPYLANMRVWPGFNDLATTQPMIAQEWDDEKNNKNTNEVTMYTHGMFWWKHNYFDTKTGKEWVFEWKASIESRLVNECPYLSKAPRAVWPGFNDMASQRPDLAKMWNRQRNYKNANQFTCFSNKRVWWKCEKDHEFRRQINDMYRRCTCPSC